MDSLVIFYNCKDFNNPKFDYRLDYQALPGGSIVVLIINAETGVVKWKSEGHYQLDEAIEYSKRAVEEMAPWYSTGEQE